MSRPCKGYFLSAAATRASRIGSDRIKNTRRSSRRVRENPPIAVSKTGRTTPRAGYTGATRFKGLTKTSSRTPPSLISSVRPPGGIGKKAKSQNTYIEVAGGKSACDARYASQKLVSQHREITSGQPRSVHQRFAP